MRGRVHGEAFLAATGLGILWGGLIWLIAERSLVALTAGPTLGLLLWFLFAKRRQTLRFIGYLAVLPVAILSFEVYLLLHDSVQGLNDIVLALLCH